MPMLATRGCPFSCGFCYNTVKRYRMRSPENIVEELTYLRRHLGVSFVEFNDILFTANRILRRFSGLENANAFAISD